MEIADNSKISKNQEKIKKVFYAGYLPIFYEVGTHPQFRHIRNPPFGYEFVSAELRGFPSIVRSVDQVILSSVKEGGLLNKVARAILLKEISSMASKTVSSLKKKRVVVQQLTVSQPYSGLGMIKNVLPVFRSFLEISSLALRKGIALSALAEFLITRDFLSQLQVPRDAKLIFVPSWPFIISRIPWVIEIEDPVTLFTPFIYNGQTKDVDVKASPYYSLVKMLLESESCRGIICHMKSTADNIPVLFENHLLARKTSHIPVGLTLPPKEKKIRRDNIIRFIFTSSWAQSPRSFYLRGGIDVLEAFAIVAEKNTNVHLVIRSRLPDDLPVRYRDIIARYNIEVIDRFLSDNELSGIMSETDIYLLPSARIHVVSILEAMAYGLALVASDGWGINEYIEDGRNGLIVKGRYGKCSWMDSHGMLREDYSSLSLPDAKMVENLVRTITMLIENNQLRERLGETARKDVQERFTVDNWNRGLSALFDRAIGKTK